jgi:branched-chain amino acid transport system permease protein
MLDIAQALTSGVLLGLVLAVLAVGLDLVFGVLRIVNFAYGDFLMVGLFAAYFSVGTLDLPIIVAGVVALVPILLMGLLLWIGVKPLHENQERQMLATLAVGILLQETGNLTLGARTRTVDSSFTDSTVSFAGVHVATFTLVAGIVCGVLAVAVFLITRRSRFGLYLRAFSANDTAARLYGVDQRTITLGAIALSSACLAAASVALLPTTYVSPTVGVSYTLLVYIAVIIGGGGTVVGAIAGGVLIQVVLSLGGLWLAGSLPDAVVVGGLLAVLATRPRGLFGGRQRVA